MPVVPHAPLRGLSGVALVTSDAHPGLVAAIGATLPGAAWQRCRTHYTTNLMSVIPKSSWPWVRTLLHSIFDQPGAESAVAQYDRVLDALTDKLPKVAEHLDGARAELLAFTAFPKQICAKSGRTIRRYRSTKRSASDRRRRHLPRPHRDHPPRRRGVSRTA